MGKWENRELVKWENGKMAGERVNIRIEMRERIKSYEYLLSRWEYFFPGNTLLC